jgi:O-antigen ligase
MKTQRPDIETGSTPVASQWNWFAAAVLVSLLVLVANSHLYPDTGTDFAWHLGSIRISPLGVIFVLTAPQIIIFSLLHLGRLKFRWTDMAILAAIGYVTLRGVVAQTGVSTNGVALVFAYGGHAAVLYYGAAIALQSKKALQVTFITLTALLAMVSVYALIEFAFGRNILYGDIIRESVTPIAGKGYHRSGSLMGHPLALGVFILQAAPFLIFLFAVTRSVKWKITLGGVFIVSVLALETTFGKGPWAYAAIMGSLAVIWFAWRNPSSRRAITLLLVSVAVGVALMTAIFSSNVGAGTFSKVREGESFNPRIYMWSRVPTVFRSNPLFGVGMYLGGPIVANVEPVITGEHKPTAIDDLYLSVLTEQGLVGFTLLTAAVILIGRDAWRLIRKGGKMAKWALPAVFCLAVTIMSGFSMDTLWMWSAMVVFWFTAGLLRALVELDDRQEAVLDI